MRRTVSLRQLGFLESLLQLRGARAKLAKPGRAAVGVAASLDEEFSTWVRVSGEPLSRSTPLVV